MAQNIDHQVILAQYKAILYRPNHQHISQKLVFPIHWMIGAYDDVIPAKSSYAEIAGQEQSYISYFSASGHMAMDEEHNRYLFKLKSYFKLIKEFYSL